MTAKAISRVAKLAGAPARKAAGVDLLVKVGDRVTQGQPLFYIHAETPAEIDYALNYAKVLALPITVAADDGKEIA